MYACVPTRLFWGSEMLRVGIRQFRQKLARFLLESYAPVAITRHGDTVGYYIPARRQQGEADRAALKEAALRLNKALASEGISGDEVMTIFKKLARKRRK